MHISLAPPRTLIHKNARARAPSTSGVCEFGLRGKKHTSAEGEAILSAEAHMPHWVLSSGLRIDQNLVQHMMFRQHFKQRGPISNREPAQLQIGLQKKPAKPFATSGLLITQPVAGRI
eukprot:704108-Pyramimonas_sp.AAC.1